MRMPEWPQRSGFHLIDRRQPALVDQRSAARRGSGPEVRSAGGVRASAFLGLLRCAAASAGNDAPMATTQANRHRHRRRQARRRGHRAGLARRRVDGGRACPSRRRRGAGGRGQGRCRPCRSDCAEQLFAAAAGLPPVRLLVNNAARFAWDGFGEFSAGRVRRAHGGQCARAGAADRTLSRAAHDGRRRAGRQFARFQARRAQSRLSELHTVQAGAGRADRACRAGACAARDPGERRSRRR